MGSWEPRRKWKRWIKVLILWSHRGINLKNRRTTLRKAMPFLKGTRHLSSWEGSVNNLEELYSDFLSIFSCWCIWFTNLWLITNSIVCSNSFVLNFSLHTQLFCLWYESRWHRILLSWCPAAWHAKLHITSCYILDFSSTRNHLQHYQCRYCHFW